jgi:predicted enzyme related to lactoylglutathione lyase
MPNPIAYIEIASQDPKKTAEFYSAVFGWRIVDDTVPQYIVFETEPGMGGAFPAADGQNYKTGEFIPHILVENIEVTLAQIEANGGMVLVPKTEIKGGVGWWAMFSSPEGVRLALLKCARKESERK